MSAAQGLLISAFDQLRVIQDQSKCAGCLTTACTGVWEFHECDQTGQLRKDCSVYKKRVDEKEKPKGERVETNAAVQGSVVETWEYDNEWYVFVLGDEMNAGVQRRETHSCTDRGAARSACQFFTCLNGQRESPHRHGFRSMDLQLNSVDTRRHTGENVTWWGEMNEFGSTMAESTVLFPVASGSSLEMNGTSVTFTCSGDCDLSRQPGRNCNLQEFHGWLIRSEVERGWSKQVGESRSRTNRW